MNTIDVPNRGFARSQFFSWTLWPLGLVLAGCMGAPAEDPPCANVTILASSADASNSFTTLDGDLCDVEIYSSLGVDQPCDPAAAPCVLEIDILDDSAGTIRPRVLFTLAIDGDSIPLDEAINLQRANDEDIAPGTYQEFSSETQDGPFWSSISGTITFTQADDGAITGEFEFSADNPSDIDNTAMGTLDVAGTVLVQAADEPQGSTCGLGSGTAAMLAVAGLAFVGRFRRRS